MIKNDVRILDYDGKTSYKGRVEIRSEGIWGTICAVGLDNSAAKIICKQIGYKGGKFLNPKENKGRGFCLNYEGVNYCGVQAANIHFSNLVCQGNEEFISDCYLATADRSICTHEYDTLIECGNTDDQQVTIFDNNTVRLIDNSNNPTSNGIGRLEILKGTWGTVCNSKFTDKSAQVACKQMGYMSGHILGQPNSNTMCSNVLGNNLCGEYSSKVKLTEVICNGHERSLKDCKTSENTVSCTHFNDVILKCEGYGDSSGASQNIKKPKVLNPSIEKLPMMPTYNAKCDTTAKNIYFRGDPGSIFMVNCPSDCTGTNFSLIGSGVYTIDSSICRAALQSGIITNEGGGNVALVKTYGQNKYYASNMRSISSLESNYMKVSFFITAPNSAYNNMISMINTNSFLELGVGVGSILHSSFLETAATTSSLIKASYDWSSPSNEFKFDGASTFVDLYLIQAARKILDMKTFTMFTKIIMRSFNKNPQTIISIGGCEGFSLTIDANAELVFDVKCGTNIYKSGIYIPVNYSTKISTVYDGIKLIFYLNGAKYNELSTYFNLQYKKTIVIGKNSEYDKDYFNGKIFYTAFFSEALGPRRNTAMYNDGYTKPDKIKPHKFITLDNRVCITSCANQPIPGIVGSPTPPPEAITYEVHGDKTVISGTIGGTKAGASDNNDFSPFIEVKCGTTAREIFKGDIKIGDKVRIKCPDDCKKPIGAIFGTIIYSFDSLACFSSVHAGLSKAGTSSMIILKVSPGLSFYQGTFQYNIQSTSIDKSDYSFTIEEAPPVIIVDCKTQGSLSQFAGTLGMKFLVKCPGKCSKIPHNVFGNELYSGDSSICQSAIHSGAINDRGGEVQFMIEPGKKLYFGSKAFGIDSKERDSYVKSIRFFNANNNLFIKYIETFSSQYINTKWDIIDNLEANDYPSKWEFVPTPGTIKTTSKFLLHQARKIRSESPLSYGSILALKNTDVVNSLYKISFYFVDLNPIGIVFRYKDDNNYYHLRINNIGAFKMILVKRYEGKSTVLASSNISITPRMWYTFTLQIFYDKFRVFLQIGELRNNQLLFETADNDIQRGALGVATDGNDDFYANGIFIDNYEMSQDKMKAKAGSDTVSFEVLLRENTVSHRQKYCKSSYPHDQEGFLSCKEFHTYCKTRCNEQIHKRENILNYSCYRSCVKDSLLKEKIANMQMNEEIGFGLNGDVWTPKEKEKCDYKMNDPTGGSFWVPCFVVEVKNNANDPEQKFVQIKYKSGSSVKVSTVLYPNITLKKCGNMLSRRVDCNKTANMLPNLSDK